MPLKRGGEKVNLQFLHDLQFDFPDLKELLASNLKYCLQFFQFNCGSGTKIIFLNPNIISFSQQSVDQLLTKFLGNHIEIRAVNFIFQPHICGVKKLL
jgi:hypothetical protein